MKWGIVFLLFLAFTNSKKDFKFSHKTFAILLVTGTPKGPVGKVKADGVSEVVYNITNSPLIKIDKDTGKLTLLKYLDELNTAKFNNTRLTIQAITIDQSEKKSTTIVVIILPLNFGDQFLLKKMAVAKRGVQRNRIMKTKAGKQLKISPDILDRSLKQGNDATKEISLAETRMEKAIELTKICIIKKFEKIFGKNAVLAFFRIKKLFSRTVITTLVREYSCNEKTVNSSITCSLKPVFRRFDGKCNNHNNPNMGAAGTAFIRIRPALYFDADGLNDPIGFPNQPNAPDVPSPFKISKDFVKAEVPTSASSELTHAVMQFGQFLDHDLDLTGGSEGSDECAHVSCHGSSSDFKAPCYPILPLPGGHPPCIRFVRSAAFCQDGYPGVRKQINDVTAFIDASQIYGSSNASAQSLREMTNDQGLLRVSEGQLLPLEDSKATNVCEQGCFVAGDIRANEQQGLTSFQTLFLREHNRMASRLKEINSDWDGERVYQETRKIMGAVLQKIVYEDYLPLILGPNAIPSYTGYDVKINPGISNAFATAAYRFGHSTIPSNFDLLNANFDPIASAVKLRFLFFNNTIIKNYGIEPVLLGLLGNVSQKVDRILTNEITHHLFERGNEHGENLAALNIQRCRDHGLPGYNEFRKFCGLKDAKIINDTKNEIKDGENRKILKRLYNDDPNLIELWVAGLAETPVSGGAVGPTFKCVIADQFRRTRDGDRFFYKRKGVFQKNILKEIEKASLSRIYCDNVKNIVSIQENAFKVPTVNNRRISCQRIKGINLCDWKECGNGVPELNTETRNCSCKCKRFWGGRTCQLGQRVLARWHNNLYYAGKMEKYSPSQNNILFDDGDKIVHSISDTSAVIPDECPQDVKTGQHVLAKRGHQYYIGFVKKIHFGISFAVHFDDNKEHWYAKCNIRIFPEHASPYEVGARVFARWTNGLYYRGFVTKSRTTSVRVSYDDGHTRWIKHDKASVILDKLENPELIKIGQRVIGSSPNRERYYSTGIVFRIHHGKYFVRYDDGYERRDKIYEIRAIPM